MKKLFLAVLFLILFSVHLHAQSFQLRLSAGFLHGVENPYKGAVEFDRAEKTNNFLGVAAEIRKLSIWSTPVITGLSVGIMNGNIFEGVRETCPVVGAPCSRSSFRSDITFFSGELMLLYPFMISDFFSVNAGLKGGLAYISLRDRIFNSLNYYSEFSPTFAPLLEIDLSVIGDLGVSVSGYYQFLETDIDWQGDTLPVSLSGPGITAGLVYNF